MSRKQVEAIRNEIARHIANFALKRIGTREYGNRVARAIRLGLSEARRQEDQDEPKVSIDWLRDQATQSDAARRVTSASSSDWEYGLLFEDEGDDGKVYVQEDEDTARKYADQYEGILLRRHRDSENWAVVERGGA